MIDQPNGLNYTFAVEAKELMDNEPFVPHVADEEEEAAFYDDQCEDLAEKVKKPKKLRVGWRLS